MKTFIRRHPVASYFILAITVSWGGVLAVIRGGPIPASSQEAQRLFAAVYLVMLAGPSIAGVLMTALMSGQEGLRDLRARLLKWRIAPRWYFVALLTAPLTLGVVTLLLSSFSDDYVPAIFGAGSASAATLIQMPSAARYLITALCVGIGAGVFEELGWTGFATPRLLARYPLFSAGLRLGAVWGVWHFLAVWWGSANAFGSVPIPVFLVVALFASLVPYRVLMLRVYENTHSVLLLMLMHASLTTSMIALSPAVSGRSLMIHDIAVGVALWVVVAAVHVGVSPARVRVTAD